MVKIVGVANGADAPRIDRNSVETFFKHRAEAGQLGHIQAVIYQDKNPELALQRDSAEKAKLLPLLNLCGFEAVLDVGCGTGRWADVIVPNCTYYLGTDFSQGLIDIAAARFSNFSHARFLRLPSEHVSNATIDRRFNLILSMGLFIYLNDEELVQTIRGYASVADSSCKILIREPVGTVARLTIREHFSEDMDQIYNAIYRTEEEIMMVLRSELFSEGFRLSGSGDVYEAALNNRSETKQRWMLMEK